MVDVRTAEHHGVCPTCEGYGGKSDPAGDGCPNELCSGSCPACWCPGCHDGQVECAEPDSGERMGSWEAYEALHRGGHTGARVSRDQEALDV